MAAVRVFVSYSWDSDEHRTWVRNLCSRLVSDGVQVRLDQWYVRAGDSFMKFMEEEIRLAEIVVVVCTPKYARKVNSRTGGVGFEGQIISSVLFKKAALKCIPIVVAGTTEPGPDYAIPSFLEGVAAIFFDSIDDADFSYEELLRAILEKPRYAPPPLGEPPELLSDSELKWGPSGGRRVAAELDYSSALNIDFSTVAAAIDAIQALGNSQTWPDFRDTRPDGLWMKSESDALVNTLYALWAPMVQFSLERTSCERRYAGFDWRSRLQVLIMAAIVNVYQDDSTIACIEPGLTYSPRVPQWRLKREGEPARYWWQGLSDERFARAVREFLTRSSAEEPLRLMAPGEFRSQYRALFASNDDGAQQALGLAANALFRFTIRDRPVYWRVLTCQALMYHGLLRTRSSSLLRPRSIDDFVGLCRPLDESAFPTGFSYSRAETAEEMSTTVRAALEYIGEMIAPRLLRRLGVELEANS